jgi:hypothetical protein
MQDLVNYFLFLYTSGSMTIRSEIKILSASLNLTKALLIATQIKRPY